VALPRPPASSPLQRIHGLRGAVGAQVDIASSRATRGSGESTTGTQHIERAADGILLNTELSQPDPGFELIGWSFNILVSMEAPVSTSPALSAICATMAAMP
jgi:hypothetical protein